MRRSQILPASLPAPTVPATNAQRQALRELASKMHPVHRSRILNGLAALTYAQAVKQVGHHYLLATRQLGDYSRSYVVPDNTMGAVLPQGSLVLLRSVSADSLNVGELVLCTDKNANASLLGVVRRVRPGRFYNERRLVLAQAQAEHTLWAVRPYLFWYRLDIISLAC
ncbi:MAG: hypothetical protein ACRYFX_13990 [Janthinobacterium lividum]